MSSCCLSIDGLDRLELRHCSSSESDAWILRRKERRSCLGCTSHHCDNVSVGRQRMTNNCTCFLSSSLIILGQYLTDCTQKYSFSKGFTFYGETNKQERRTKTQSTVLKQHIHETIQNYSYSMFVDVSDRYQFLDDAVEVSIRTTTLTVPNC